MIKLKNSGASTGTRVYGTETYWISYWQFDGMAKWWQRFHKKRTRLQLKLDHVSTEGTPALNGDDPLNWCNAHVKGAVQVITNSLLIIHADGTLKTVFFMIIKFSKTSDAIRFKLFYPMSTPCE